MSRHRPAFKLGAPIRFFSRLSSLGSIELQSYLDPGLFLALALALIAALPFLTRPGLPRGTDAELHVFRAAELGYSLRAGDSYPRWAPDFYYGYGYPIFNYYAPLTYYAANFVALLPAIDIIGGVKGVFILGLCGAAVGMYLFVRDWIGPRPGLLAAALYVLSPYVFFIDPHMRGVLAESFSLGLFAPALWAYGRLLLDRRRRWMVLAAILQAALIMTHNLLGLVLSAMALAFLGWELVGRLGAAWRQGGARTALVRWWPEVGRVFLVPALGVGLSAIFWLPMLLERGDVQLTLTGPGHFDFHNHFLTPGALLAPSPILDLGAAGPRFGFNLGLPQWPLALTALLALFWGAMAQRRLAGFFVLCSAGLIALMLPLSTPVWEAVPGMVFLQFPWRLLGPAGAALSVAAAAGYGWVAARERWGRAALGLGVGLTLVLALPAMFPPLWEADFGPTDPAAMLAFEQTGVAVGTTSTGDFVPATVEISPHPEPAYLATYTAPGGVDKVNRATLPAGTVVEVISHGPTHDRFYTQSDKAFILRLFTHHFPGWRATVDGRQVPIDLGRPEGFINVKLPAGAHTVEVRFEAWGTPARAIGTLISLFSAGGMLLVAVGRRSRPLRLRGSFLGKPGKAPFMGSRPTPVKASPADGRFGPETAQQGLGDYPKRRAERLSERARGGVRGDRLALDWRAWRVAGGVILAFFVFKVGLVDGRHDWFRRTSPPGQVLGAGYTLTDTTVDFGGHIQLLGYDLPRAEVPSGGTLPLTLYWRATAPVPNNYQVFVHLVQPAAHLWGQSDNLNPGDFPTTRWPLDKYVWDDHELAVLPGTPPGDYQLAVGLYTLSSGVRVPVSGAGGTFLGDIFPLPTRVQVTRPRRPPVEAELGLTDVIGAGYAGQITLLGAVLPDRHVELPGFVHLALLWRAEVAGPGDVTVQVQLLDDTGQVADEIITVPVDGRYPSSLWSAGEVVRDQYSFWLSGDFAPGEYELRVRLADLGDWVSLGTVQAVGQ
jgi:hypothetical protein